MRKTLICVLLACCLLLACCAPAILAEEERDPFDQGPIEPFEDTPDWAEAPDPGWPQYEPGMPLHVLVTDGYVHSMLPGLTGEVPMDIFLVLHMQKNDMSSDIAGHYRGTAEVSGVGKILPDGVSQMMQLNTELTFGCPAVSCEMGVEMSETYALYKSLYAQHKAAYFAKYGKEFHSRTDEVGTVYASGYTSYDITGMGSVAVQAKGMGANVDEKFSGEDTAPVEMTVHFYDKGYAAAVLKLKGTELKEWPAYVQNDADYTRITAPSGL